jgi:hypothetical protein
MRRLRRDGCEHYAGYERRSLVAIRRAGGNRFRRPRVGQHREVTASFLSNLLDDFSPRKTFASTVTVVAFGEAAAPTRPGRRVSNRSYFVSAKVH